MVTTPSQVEFAQMSDFGGKAALIIRSECLMRTGLEALRRPLLET